MFSRLYFLVIFSLCALLFWPTPCHFHANSQVRIGNTNQRHPSLQDLFPQASAVSIPESHNNLASSSAGGNVIEGVFLDQQNSTGCELAKPCVTELSSIQTPNDSFISTLTPGHAHHGTLPPYYPIDLTSKTIQPFNTPKHLRCFRTRKRITESSPISNGNFSNGNNNHATILTHPTMNVSNYRLLQYRRLMKQHAAASASELHGTWRGINKGIATVAIDKQFVKRFYSQGGQTYGDNVSVHQLPHDQLGQSGWQQKLESSSGKQNRSGQFLVQPPQRIGTFRHGAVLNYRQGGNRRFDPTRLIEDKLVKLDDNHMLGRATAKFGPIKIPLSYFVIERIQ